MVEEVSLIKKVKTTVSNDLNSKGNTEINKLLKLRQPGYTCSACGPFTKTKKVRKFKEIGDWRCMYIYI